MHPKILYSDFLDHLNEKILPFLLEVNLLDFYLLFLQNIKITNTMYNVVVSQEKNYLEYISPD